MSDNSTLKPPQATAMAITSHHQLGTSPSDVIPNAGHAVGVISLDDPPPPPLKQMSIFRIRMWIGFCVAFVVLAPVISVILGVTQHARNMTYPLPRDHEFTGRTLVFEAVLIAADPKQGSMRLDWRLMEEESSPCNAGNLDACTDVNIYFDTNLLRAEGTFSVDPNAEILSSRPPDRPIFIVNAKGFASKDVKAKTPAFRTQLALFSPGDHPSSLLYYPFDRYTAEIVFWAEEVGTNAPVGTRIGNTRGIAVGFETHIKHRLDIEIPNGLTEAVIVLTRSTLVMSYSIVATIAVWVVTLILVLVMVTSVFFGYRQRPEVLLIPVATLFAFTQLRQSMPGAPDGFDLVGLVPCLALLALTAALSLGIFLFSDPASTKRELRWKNMQEAFPLLFIREKTTLPQSA